LPDGHDDHDIEKPDADPDDCSWFDSHPLMFGRFKGIGKHCGPDLAPETVSD
jgi:hypothetical protein